MCQRVDKRVEATDGATSAGRSRGGREAEHGIAAAAEGVHSVMTGGGGGRGEESTGATEVERTTGAALETDGGGGHIAAATVRGKHCREGAHLVCDARVGAGGRIRTQVDLDVMRLSHGTGAATGGTKVHRRCGRQRRCAHGRARRKRRKGVVELHDMWPHRQQVLNVENNAISSEDTLPAHRRKGFDGSNHIKQQQ